MLLPHSNERISNQAVKASMSRLKIVALLPALWLLVGPSLPDLCAGCDTLSVSDSNSAFTSGKLGHSHQPMCPDISTRAVHSRVGKITSKGSLPPFDFLSCSNSTQAASPVLSPPPGPAALAASWQFTWRAALEPRAPASLS